jgi:hypothetical protein
MTRSGDIACPAIDKVLPIEAKDDDERSPGGLSALVAATKAFLFHRKSQERRDFHWKITAGGRFSLASVLRSRENRPAIRELLSSLRLPKGNRGPARGNWGNPQG